MRSLAFWLVRTFVIFMYSCTSPQTSKTWSNDPAPIWLFPPWSASTSAKLSDGCVSHAPRRDDDDTSRCLLSCWHWCARQHINWHIFTIVNRIYPPPSTHPDAYFHFLLTPPFRFLSLFLSSSYVDIDVTINAGNDSDLSGGPGGTGCGHAGSGPKPQTADRDFRHRRGVHRRRRHQHQNRVRAERLRRPGLRCDLQGEAKVRGGGDGVPVSIFCREKSYI